MAYILLNVSGSTAGTSGTSGTAAVNQYIMTMDNPLATENAVIGYTTADITISNIYAVVKGTSPSVTINPTHTTDRSITGTTILSAEVAITGTTTPHNLTSFNDNTIPANSYILFITSATGGTATQVSTILKYTID
jgi:hypothetical protein